MLSVLITFVVGFFAGGYLYLNQFTAMVQPDNLDTKEEIEQFEVTSRTYGGCRNNCPAFQISNDGTYRYQYSPTVGADPVIRSGTLPLDIQSKLKKSLKAKDLEGQTESISPEDCASFRDGIDIVYDVVLAGETYTLDSCRTAIDDRSDAWAALSAVWTYFNEISK